MLNQPGLPSVVGELETWILFQYNLATLRIFSEFLILKEMLAWAGLPICSLCMENSLV